MNSFTGTMSKRLWLGAVGAVAAIGLSLSVAAPANAASQWWIVKGTGSAATSCAGTMKRQYALAGGKVEVRVFYSSAAGGTNCIIAYNMTGSNLTMGVNIQDTRTGNNQAYNYGSFSTYAGAARISQMNGKCVNFDAGVNVNGRNYSVNITRDLCS